MRPEGNDRGKPLNDGMMSLTALNDGNKFLNLKRNFTIMAYYKLLRKGADGKWVRGTLCERHTYYDKETPRTEIEITPYEGEYEQWKK